MWAKFINISFAYRIKDHTSPNQKCLEVKIILRQKQRKREENVIKEVLAQSSN